MAHHADEPPKNSSLLSKGSTSDLIGIKAVNNRGGYFKATFFANPTPPGGF